MNSSWEDFEERVRHVYDVLLNLKDEGVVVARDVRLQGRDGQWHQFDVFYQFTRGDVNHAVGIECKNHRRPVDKGRVLEFKAKVEDVLGLRGIIVAANGFQDGARRFAENNGIIAIEAGDLPGLGNLLGARLESVALPDDTTVGEPFWAIYELRDGKNTGSPLGALDRDPKVGFLFLSKAAAQRFLESSLYLSQTEWAVRGLPQRSLRAFLMVIDCFNGLPMIVSRRNSDGTVEGAVWQRQLFIDEFYVGRIPISADPQVMPGWEADNRPCLC